ECRADQSPTPYVVSCPDSAERTTWANRFQTLNQRWVALNGQVDLYSISFALASLASSMAEGKTRAAQSLQDGLTSAQEALDFPVASYLAAFGVLQYQGTNIVDYVRGYAAIPQYELAGTSIAFAAAWLLSNGAMSRADVQDLMSKLASASTVSVGTKLYIDEYQYNSQW